MNGDVLAKVRYTELLDFHHAHGGAATLAVREYAVQIPFGVTDVEPDGRVRAVTEKPTERFIVNAGIYVIDPACLALIPKDTYFDMTTLLGELLAQDLGVYSYVVDGYWLDVGRAADLQQAHADFDAQWRDDEDAE